MTAMPTKPELSRRRPLNIAEILQWADRYKGMSGFWPTKDSGIIAATVGETWLGVDYSLRHGNRGLPGGSSLVRLLTEHRSFRNNNCPPPLTQDQILAWADSHHRRTGTWPTTTAGAVYHMKGESWENIQAALRMGLRGLPGGSSLAQLLAEHRGVRNRKALPLLTEERVLQWADRHFQRTGAWPRRGDGPVMEAPGESWGAIDIALKHGRRGQPGGSSLALLLAEQRGVRHARIQANLTVEQVLAWADAFHERVGTYPTHSGGPIREAPEDTWLGVDKALKKGTRSLPGGFSLAELLAVERGVRNQVTIPCLTLEGILAWADAYFQREGKWPTKDTGPIPESPEENWHKVDAALRGGGRGLRGGSSLAKLLDRTGRKAARHG